MLGLGLFFDKGGHFPSVVYEFSMGAPLRTLFVVNDYWNGMEVKKVIKA